MKKYTFLRSENSVTLYSEGPQIVGEYFEAMVERDGCLKPKVIVDEARPEDAVLHGYFNWDDFEAAESWRREQAGKLIRSIRVITDDVEGDEPVLERPFIHVKPTAFGESGAYFSTAVVMSNSEMRQQALAEALAFLSRAKGKLKEFKELEKQYAAIEKVEDGLMAVQMELRRKERANETVRALQAV